MTYLLILLIAMFVMGVIVYRAYQAGLKQERGSHAERIQKAAIQAVHIRRRILSDPDFRRRMRKKYK